jgi:hypothetical protein
MMVDQRLVPRWITCAFVAAMVAVLVALATVLMAPPL